MPKPAGRQPHALAAAWSFWRLWSLGTLVLMLCALVFMMGGLQGLRPFQQVPGRVVAVDLLARELPATRKYTRQTVVDKRVTYEYHVEGRRIESTRYFLLASGDRALPAWRNHLGTGDLEPRSIVAVGQALTVNVARADPYDAFVEVRWPLVWQLARAWLGGCVVIGGMVGVFALAFSLTAGMRSRHGETP